MFKKILRKRKFRSAVIVSNLVLLFSFFVNNDLNDISCEIYFKLILAMFICISIAYIYVFLELKLKNKFKKKGNEYGNK